MTSSASSTPRKLRILALHGYTSNSFILNRRFGAIRKACRNVCEFEFINGPLVVQPITSTQSLDAPDREGDEEITEENTPLEEQPRAWWRASDDGRYEGIEQSWNLLSQVIAKGERVDGVVGFSQGERKREGESGTQTDPRLPLRRRLLGILPCGGV